MTDEHKYITLKDLAYFLEKLKYELAHNGKKEEDNNTEKSGD